MRSEFPHAEPLAYIGNRAVRSKPRFELLRLDPSNHEVIFLHLVSAQSISHRSADNIQTSLRMVGEKWIDPCEKRRMTKVEMHTVSIVTQKPLVEAVSVVGDRGVEPLTFTMSM